MDKIAEAMQAVGGLLLEGWRNRHASLVMAMTGVLDYDLERAIKKKMRPLNAEMNNRLFRGYGPLGTFAGRIDVAYALGITTREVHTELNKMRKIRNLFAHTRHMISLDKEPVRPLLDSLKRPGKTRGRYEEIFFECARAIDDKLEQFLASMGETEDLRLLREKNPPKRSRKK